MRKLPLDSSELVLCAAQASAGARSLVRVRRWMFVVICAIAAIGFPLIIREAPAQPRVSEYSVKAAYLLNFGKFVRAPKPEPSGAFDICILGQDPFGPALDSITANELINGHPVHVLRLARAAAARDCSIAYIASTDARLIDEDIAAIGSADVLTVSDAPDFLKHGGMIEFVLVANHVRFAVNLDAVHRSHIVLSSELLRVAASVVGGSGEGQTGRIGEVQR